VQVFTKEGEFKQTMGSSGSGPGCLNPCGVAVDGDCNRDDNLLIADCGNNRVCVFKKDGLFVTSFGSSHLKGPTGVAVDRKGVVVVVECENHRLSFFQ